MVFVASVWAGQRGLAQTWWMLALPAIAVVAELGQMTGTVPGTFDFFDLVFLVIVSIVAYIILKPPYEN